MCDRDWITVATRDERSAPDLTVQLGGIVEAALIVPVHRREQHHRVEPVPSKTLAGTRDAVQIFDMRKGRPFDGIFRCSLSLRQFVSYGFASDLPPVSVASVSAIRRAQAIAASPRFFPAWLRLRAWLPAPLPVYVAQVPMRGQRGHFLLRPSPLSQEEPVPPPQR